MSNLSGMISVDRFVFNEQDNPDLLTDVHHLGNSAADEHLRNLCVKCHLDNPKTETGPVTEKAEEEVVWLAILTTTNYHQQHGLTIK